MKYFIYISISLILVGILLYFTSFNSYKARTSNEPLTSDPIISSQDKWDVQVDEQSAVSVEIVPIDLSPDSATWKFNIVFNAHTGNLNDDLLGQVLLVDDKGVEYKPIAWEGSEPGGHHREGVLIFETIRPTPLFLEIVVRDVGDVSKRSFRWNI